MFDRVVCKTDSLQKEYWFIWSDDYEPIRIAYREQRIISATHRLHWKHIDVVDPYNNDKNRIEAFFFPYTHTPRIRKAENDVLFDVLVSGFATPRIEQYQIVDEPIPEYYICSGRKERHFPPVDYGGWPTLT